MITIFMCTSKHNQFLLLFSSAFLYALPFLLIDYMWWLIFIFPIPMFYGACIQDFSFKQGYVWGLIVFLLHLSGGIYVIAAMAGQAWYVGLLLGFGMVAYQALFAGLFFWIAHSIITVCAMRSHAFMIVVWTVLLGMFIIWADRYSLWILDVQEGYCLMHPLIALARHPCLLRLIAIFGKTACMYLFLSVGAAATLFLLHKNKRTFFLLLSTVLPWIVCWCTPVERCRQPEWLCAVKSLPYIISCDGGHVASSMKFLGNECKKIISQWPATEVIVMPESALGCDNLVNSPELLQLWDEQRMGKAVHIIFGAFRWRDGNYYNAVHWVYNGVLQLCFDKRHAMCLSERLSEGLRFINMQQIYCTQGPEVTASRCKRVPMKIGSLEELSVFYICSELFFNEYPDDDCSDVLIIAMINDSIFAKYYWATYINKLLLLLAHLKAVCWRREILYVSYTQSVFIDKKGAIIRLEDVC